MHILYYMAIAVAKFNSENRNEGNFIFVVNAPLSHSSTIAVLNKLGPKTFIDS